MNTAELIALWRTETGDIEQPYLWADDEALVYLNDAYQMFVRFVGGIPDTKTTGVARVLYAANDYSVAIDRCVMRVTRAFRASDGVELSVVDHTDAPLVRVGGKLALMRPGTASGNPEYLIMGADVAQATMFPTPTSAGTLNLQVRRMPLDPLVAVATSVPEIAEEHHIHLLKWAKALAYRKPDIETYDLARAQEFENAFLQYCSQAVHEVERLRRKSRVGLRAGRDLKNPMLTGAGYRAYDGRNTASAQPQDSQRGG